MHVSGKGHLHNKRYGPYNFLVESKKIGHYQFLGHHFEIPSYSPLYLQSHVSQNVYPKILGKWHKNNTAEPNTQHHARFWQGTPPQQKIWAIKFFGRVKKIGHYQFLGHHFEIPSCSPLYLQGHVSQNVYPKILGKWHKNNTAEPNTQHHARFWQGTPPQQKIWAI